MPGSMPMAKEVFTLADLRDGAEPEMRLAVIGDPVAHSRSPQMQNAALAKLGLPHRYGRVQLGAGEFAEGVARMRDLGFLGANVTLPHKVWALRLCTDLSEGAQTLGAVNTLLFEGEKVRGFNTDGPGFVRALRDEFGVDLHDLRVLLLGAGGGAGRALATQCALAKCERLALVNRDFAKARALAAELAPYLAHETRLLGPTARIVAAEFNDDSIAAEIAHTDLVVNCTPLGLRFTDPLPLHPRLLQAHLLVFDTVYAGAGSTTRLVQAAREAGARAASGEALLLHQGALAFEIWFNRPAPIDAMRAALR